MFQLSFYCLEMFSFVLFFSVSVLVLVFGYYNVGLLLKDKFIKFRSVITIQDLTHSYVHVPDSVHTAASYLMCLGI